MDTTTEAFEPGWGIGEVMHALGNEDQDEILPVTTIPYLQPLHHSRNGRHPTMDAEEGSGTNRIREEDGLRDLHNRVGLHASEARAWNRSKGS